MVGYSFGNDGRFVNKNWHRVRHIAKTETYGLQEWGEIDIEKYDLDNVKFNRAEKDSTYITESMVEVEGGAQGGIDIRKYPTLSCCRE